ncbi:hypothetical protein LTR56_023336 [Elasticomyces elasticus]|nr:hypothetical protein LTR56_023336 [Elasticomyces elasticus]KAK3625830.1 hypothetical protein LTR22_023397 [Elasticomyces elasticus]KAK4906810.1 hypothetical protein LTR49_024092 [Elasticomyces elasticus]KAK5755442.1 hypothetical protein LTS12_014427 [Elasticomyces elasticus]
MNNAEYTALLNHTERFLRGLFDTYAPNEVSSRILHLATTPEDNPLKQLVRATDGHAHATHPVLPSGATSQDAIPRKQKFSLRFSRNKDRAEAETSRHQNVFQTTDVKLPVAGAGGDSQCCGLPPREHAASPKAKSSASTAATYNCVFCRTDYTTKGTCKRHLEEIHVAKRYFRCLMCSHHFSTAPEARKHCQTCGAGLLGYKTEIPSEHKLYSSEFLPHQVFPTQQGYVNHLLDLSVAANEPRPVRSYHKKLRNLLEQHACEKALRSLSLRLFMSAEGWRDARWEHERVKKAVHELEHGILECGTSTDDVLKQHKMEKFLTDLFNDRAVSTALAPSSPPRQRATLVPRIETHGSALSKRLSVSPLPEPTTKRPLSVESSARTPIRQPPGPPTPTTNYHRDQPSKPQYEHRYHQQQAQPQAIPQHIQGVPASGVPQQQQQQQMMPYHSPVSPQHTTFQVPQQVYPDHPTIFWPPQDPQPPPYNDAYSQGTLQQPGYNTANILPEQNFATGMLGFDNNDFIPFADLSVASRMASPTHYMPSADDAMGFYSTTSQQYAQQMPAEQQHISSGVMDYTRMAFAPTAGEYQGGTVSNFHPSQQQQEYGGGGGGGM